MNQADIIDLFHQFINEPFWLSLTIILVSFILEDLATIGAAIVTASAGIDFKIPLLALFIGIVIGDIGLYMIGKYSGRIQYFKRFIDHDKTAKAKKWLDRNLLLAVLLSRFIPGMRLPTYVATGLFGLALWRFLTVVLLAVTLWTGTAFYLFYTLGENAHHIIGSLL